MLTAKEHNIKTHGGKKSNGDPKRSKPIIRFKLNKNNKRYDIKEYINATSAGIDVGCTKSVIHHAASGNTELACSYFWEYVKIKEDIKFKNEVWKKICEIDDKFKDVKHEISDFGRVKSYAGIVSYGSKTINGYMSVGIRGINYFVHTLVCLAFNGKKPSDKHSVDHINKIKDDNNKENLWWATYEEQADNNNSKPINVYKDGKFIGKYKSQAFASRELKLELGGCDISACIKKNATSKKGYTFEIV